MNLFASEKDKESILLPLLDGDVIYYPNFFSSEEASVYFKMLKDKVEWQQDDIKLFGKTYKQPRLTALYGSNEKPYSYSGITMFPKPFISILKEIKQKIEKISEVQFTTALLNLYRDGNDSNGWHSDNEKELGQNPVIVSISFGADRVFQLRYKHDKKGRANILLENGSLLLMKGRTQENWQHQIPKSKKITEPRINITFRYIK